MDKQRITGYTFLVLKKAFDLVDDHCLLHKLGNIMELESLKWLLLELRRSKYNQNVSSSLAIGYGVPLGSILSPILFVIYINDLMQSLLKTSIGTYADASVIYFSDVSAEIIKQVLQNGLNNVEQWLASNRLVLNQSKTKWMLFGTRQNLEHCSDH